MEKLLEPFDREVAPKITTTTLPPGGVNVPYNATLSASGTQPITWSIESGSLPSGLSFSNGTISGTPDTVETQTFTVKATNTTGSDTRTFSITVTIVTVTGIAITTLPTKTTYLLGASLDTTGLVVTATYSNGATGAIPNASLTINTIDSSTAGEKTITVTYETQTATFSVIVVDAAPPVMETIPAVTNWNVVNTSGDVVGTVTLSAFSIAKYEVTQELYLAVMGYNPSNFSSNPDTGEVQGKRPVENVTWFDAIEFCNKLSVLEGLEQVFTITNITRNATGNITAATVIPDWSKNGYRLPTEVQWQYAAQSGEETEYTATTDNAWHSANSNNMTHQVGLKDDNAFGLYDMLGNVFEWCWDWYAASPYPSGNTDPTGAYSGSYRVFRGGFWDNSASFTRSAYRYFSFPNYRFINFGFRLLRP